MAAMYEPVVAVEEFSGHSMDEIRFACGMKQSVDGLFAILNGEKKGSNARDFCEELMQEAEEMKKRESE